MSGSQPTFAGNQFEPSTCRANDNRLDYTVSLDVVFDETGITGDLHDAVSISPYNTWINSGSSDGTSYHTGTVTGYCWVAAEFDKVYSLGEMWVWNGNIKYVNRGFKNVIIQYSTDGSGWTRLGGVGKSYIIDKASGTHSYAHDWADPGSNEFYFGGASVRYVVITAIDNWGGGYYGLSEVRFYILDP